MIAEPGADEPPYPVEEGGVALAISQIRHGLAGVRDVDNPDQQDLHPRAALVRHCHLVVPVTSDGMHATHIVRTR